MEERLEVFISKYSDENIENKSSDAAISFVFHQVNYLVIVVFLVFIFSFRIRMFFFIRFFLDGIN